MILGLDFETYSDAPLKRVGAWPYSAHPSTGVHCASLVLASGPEDRGVRWRWFPGDRLPGRAVQHIESGGLVLAHNASFERSILANCATVASWPKILVTQWRDTKAVAAAANLPQALGDLCAALGTPVQKDAEGHALMLQFATPAAQQTMTPVQLQRLMDYCEVDVLAMLLAWWRLPKLTLAEQQAFVEDSRVNQRGVLVDQRRAATMLRMAKERKRQLELDAFEANGDFVRVLGSNTLKVWLQEQGVVLPKVARKRADGTTTSSISVNKAIVSDLLKKPDLDPVVREVLSARTEHGKAGTLAKLARVPDLVGADGRLRNALRFCAAHTGRWASYGLQIHNLPRDLLGDERPLVEWAVGIGDLRAIALVHDLPLVALLQMLRSLFIAPPGRDLIGGDYAAIEARVVAWLAGQQDKLDVFQAYDATEGRPKAARLAVDPYQLAARRSGSEDRQLGKVLVLGLGFGMGALKFLVTAAGRGILLDRRAGWKIHTAWREDNPAIVQFWADLDNAAAAAILEPGTVFKVGRLKLAASDDCLGIQLPSGRMLRYWRPSVVTATKRIEVLQEDGTVKKREFEAREIRFFTAGGDDDGGGGDMELESTYGGKLAENVTQAVARDLLAAATIGFGRSPYDVVMHVHDSLLAEVDEGAGSVPEFAKIMAAPPSWAAGLPIAVDCYRGKRFRG